MAEDGEGEEGGEGGKGEEGENDGLSWGGVSWYPILEICSAHL